MPDVVLLNLTGDITSFAALEEVEIINLKGASRLSGNVTGWSALTQVRDLAAGSHFLPGISDDGLTYGLLDL